MKNITFQPGWLLEEQIRLFFRRTFTSKFSLCWNTEFGLGWGGGRFHCLFVCLFVCCLDISGELLHLKIVKLLFFWWFDVFSKDFFCLWVFFCQLYCLLLSFFMLFVECMFVMCVCYMYVCCIYARFLYVCVLCLFSCLFVVWMFTVCCMYVYCMDVSCICVCFLCKC